MGTPFFRVDSIGVNVTVTCTDAAFLASLQSAWEPATLPDTAPAAARTVDPLMSEEEAAQLLTTEVTLSALQAQRGNLLMLHAAGLADDHGRVAALIGPSGRGKTTAARTLAAHFGYVTDETVAITAEDRVLPYRKPLSVIVPGSPYKVQLSPVSLGLKPLPDAPLTLSHLVLLDRRESHEGTARIEAVPLVEALTEIIPQTSYLRELERPLQWLAALAERTGGVVRIVYAESHSLPDALQAVLDGAGRHDGEWAAVVPDAELGVAAEGDGESLVPLTVLDAVEAEGQTAVLQSDGMLQHLQGVGPVLWRGLCRGESPDQLTARVEEAFGPAPDGDTAAALRDVLEAFWQSGLLSRVSPAEGVQEDPAAGQSVAAGR
ncbi:MULTISPECIES: hypothetical protein [Arthrobacter]|uniref:AAA+ ATPase domain-containing protein n=2 Tax=Arthrobacter TaxID=1663 RepID=A0ABU9KNT1_9MICC|nr:hypothetical protein [Arthrobacter sp. YJM1]MDP5227745.1 hypothetical protein [Arthrobacter sp. YJM1]